ncbi:hypothetical protein MKJ04_01090 [Pontibacter sp. E15-1]|uniref:hypothetical protein n=1 Tax=Pontibacter sp. E15-1 TaxID=2919918 RepID=UPI001F4FF212|nr:hypothetical protein [Pontibacter sp. E15-1]MCJ8163416.1 hypothetical protein [Pontibacter sp. E15-1]
MLQSRKKTEDYNSYAEQVIKFAQKSGYDNIKADFTGYTSPASLSMVNTDLTLTPDFTARRGNDKYYFELVVKNDHEEEQRTLISKWKVLESVARMKGGCLRLFVPRGSYRFATTLLQQHNIEAQLTKLDDL